MPTKKPRIQALVKENTYIEFKEICEKENRSESNMAAIAIEEFVKKYKKENNNITNASDRFTKKSDDDEMKPFA